MIECLYISAEQIEYKREWNILFHGNDGIPKLILSSLIHITFKIFVSNQYRSWSFRTLFLTFGAVQKKSL